MVRIAENAGNYEPEPTTADLNGDGWDDVVLTKVNFQSYETFALDILASDQKGGMVLATPAIFQGPVPRVQNPRQVVLADFNGDGRSDLFVADHGYDAHPFPGYQNTLVLSAPGGKLVDGTSGLPQQSDFTHSAAAADIDRDGDIDLYNGNIWGQAEIDPQILLNDGSGKFSVGKKRLPPLVSLNQNGYTTCAFSDIDNDGDPDLILGDAGDDINNEHSTPNSEVLVNDGKGVFGLLPDAMPAKDHDTSDIAHDIEPVDLNGDAYLDLFIVYEKQPAQGSYIQALVNNRDGRFETRLHQDWILWIGRSGSHTWSCGTWIATATWISWPNTRTMRIPTRYCS